MQSPFSMKHIFEGYICFCYCYSPAKPKLLFTKSNARCKHVTTTAVLLQYSSSATKFQTNTNQPTKWRHVSIVSTYETWNGSQLKELEECRSDEYFGIYKLIVCGFLYWCDEFGLSLLFTPVDMCYYHFCVKYVYFLHFLYYITLKFPYL